MINLDVIEIEEISVEKSDDFFEKQMQYLLNDKMLLKEEDAKHFSGKEYRNTLKKHMIRENDKHHMIYFKELDQIIGAAQYTTYQSEDGKCFILDFWVFPEFRGRGKGKDCFHTLEKHTKKDGALYYQLNAMKEDSIKFWKSLGFVDNGVDEYKVKLFIKK